MCTLAAILNTYWVYGWDQHIATQTGVGNEAMYVWSIPWGSKEIIIQTFCMHRPWRSSGFYPLSHAPTLARSAERKGRRHETSVVFMWHTIEVLVKWGLLIVNLISLALCSNITWSKFFWCLHPSHDMCGLTWMGMGEKQRWACHTNTEDRTPLNHSMFCVMVGSSG